MRLLLECAKYFEQSKSFSHVQHKISREQFKMSIKSFRFKFLLVILHSAQKAVLFNTFDSSCVFYHVTYAFRVNLHSGITLLPGKSLHKTEEISQFLVTASRPEPTDDYLVFGKTHNHLAKLALTDWAALRERISMVLMTLCSCHVIYVF